MDTTSTSIRKSKRKWLIWTVSISIVLAAVYLILHQFHYTESYAIQYINENDHNIVKDIVSQGELSRKDSLTARDRIYEYITCNYPLENDSCFMLYLNANPLQDLSSTLPTYPLKVKSFFWVNGSMILLEVVFWSLFGLLSGLLFSVLSAANFDPKRIPEHIGKFIYTPFLAVIIYLSIHLLSSSGTEVFGQTGKGAIVLSYIIGFYSRRAVVLLGRVKDLILPATSREKKDDKEETEETENDPFKQLDHEKQKEIINDYIDANADSLKKQFDEIQGISARRKSIKGVKQNYYCLHLDIIEKSDAVAKDKQIPKTVSYQSPEGTTYEIETDISSSGSNTLESAPQFIGEHTFPKKLGLSCSRITSDKVGTIGMKVYKYDDPKPYLLSCYHVLCAPEMADKKGNFDQAKTDADTRIISPGSSDAKQSQKVIAHVTEGVLNNFLDAALAELTESNILSNEFYNSYGKIEGVRRLSSDDVERGTKVYLYGRSSGFSSGKLIDSRQAKVYFNDYPSNILPNGDLWNLIVVSRMSQGGDSGAPVVDENNKIVGMLVGSSTSYSYIIPIYTLRNRLNLNINKLN